MPQRGFERQAAKIASELKLERVVASPELTQQKGCVSDLRQRDVLSSLEQPENVLDSQADKPRKK